MTIKDIITDTLQRVYHEQTGAQLSETFDDLVLLETGLDSMGFAVLVVELEEILGFDPFSVSDEPFYPTTLNEFISFYEANEPK